MDKVLIAGIETVVGGNLAATLSRQMAVTGVALSEPVSFDGCSIDTRTASTAEAIQQLIERVQPSRVILCGNAARSGWEGSTQPNQADIDQAAWWTDAVQRIGAHLTLISSDAIFSGPWMFHSENSHSLCSSSAALSVQKIESNLIETSPHSLIFRTHAFGWQPGGKNGWIESLLTHLERNLDSNLDCTRYASPILATDLTDILIGAWSAGLSGIYHVAGAERVNPVQFASRLAHQFHLPIPLSLAMESLINRPSGYGCGETSLQTRRIRRALGVSLPMLNEGLQRLFQQHVSGYRAQLSGTAGTRTSRVA